MASTTRRAPVAAHGDEARPASMVDRAFLFVGLALIALAVSTFAVGGGNAFDKEPFDLTINLVAADRLLDRDPLYDAEASRVQAVAASGEIMEDAYTVPTNGFPGPPSTALVHAPFALLGHDAGIAAFRWVTFLGMVGAVVLTAAALPPASRVAGATFGVAVLLVSSATLGTVVVGQGHGFLMLAFAAAIWGAATGRWKLVGVALGVATALKLSPALLVAYLVLRGRREVLGPAIATVVGLTVAAAAVGRPQDVLVWATDVVPALSGGAFRSMNQSLPAWIGRMASNETDLGGTHALGAWRLLAMPILIAGVAVLWRQRRGRSIDPLELGALILLGLVAGPLSWDHYLTWAVLPLVLLVDPRRWRDRSTVERSVLGGCIGISLLLLYGVVPDPSAAQVAADWTTRLRSGPMVIAQMLLLGVTLRLLPAELRSPAAAEPGAPPVPAPALAHPR
jgi:alpha-1,2-mannosyltransferase